MSKPEVDPALLAVVVGAAGRATKLAEHCYDGVAGSLPEWLGKSVHSEFETLRTEALRHAGQEALTEYVSIFAQRIRDQDAAIQRYADSIESAQARKPAPLSFQPVRTLPVIPRAVRAVADRLGVISYWTDYGTDPVKQALARAALDPNGTRQRSLGGRAAARNRKSEDQGHHATVMRHLAALRAEGLPEREIVGLMLARCMRPDSRPYSERGMRKLIKRLEELR